MTLVGRLSSPIAQSTVRTSAVLVVRLAVQAANLFLLARLFGPGQFGAFASLVALAVFLGNLATFGTHLTLLRDLSRDHGQRDAVLPAVLGTTAFCGSGLLLGYVVVATLLLGSGAVEWPVLLCIGVAELLVQPLLTISAVERMSDGRIAGTQMLRMLPLPMQLAVAGFLSMADATSPLIFYSLGHLASVLIALAISRGLSSPWPNPRRWRLFELRRWKDYGGFALVSVTASGPTELDKAIAVRLMPIETAGVYAAASRIAGALTIPVSSMLLSALPRLFRISAGGAAQRNLVAWILICGFGYGVTAAAALWLLAPLLQRPFGAAYIGVLEGMRWLALAVPGLCLRLAATNVLMSVGRPGARAAIELGGISLMLGCGVALASSAGLQGMVIAVTISETAMAIVGWGWILLRCWRT